MVDRRFLVAANWKLNGSTQLVNEMTETFKEKSFSNVDVVFFPSYPYITLFNESNVKVGAQNISLHQSGAYTGEVSANMLADIACQYVILGHSERRTIFGETNTEISNKFALAQQCSLIPILCVGETAEENERGETEKVIREQLSAVINECGVDAFAQAVIAYEPVWAIGTGKTATPEQAQAVHAFIREFLAELSPEIAQGLQILYGGSVNASNSESLFSQPDIDGGLIGGASLKPDEFYLICQSAQGIE
ncbi:triose-phosphate isomerase [Flocculibacter collagenilyticus]|uniref:triose-phosphate isomerase n=1 Tax=Flocculibacter collagenilyticus TaxID=2744479 RepID=UPI0018F6ADFC|nr:triose-phosphate isomerase [Flocculibacter collagenilyticus]